MDDLRDRLQATLGDAYRIERELGGGGMARVFLAEERALGRRVAVKVLSPELAAGVSAERFAREIRLTAQLQHPQIVPVLAAGSALGLPYYLMPYIEGESLRDELARRGPLPVGDAVHVLRDVAKALAFAHERGIVHRDIKPGNILLTEASATVADFGIGKALSASATQAGADGTLTGLGTAVGTPAYVAPEQAAGDAGTDHRADLYSFGVLAYEMLAGAPPFAGRTPRETLAAVMSEAPRALRAVRPDGPAPLAELVMRCLAKDPAARPQSAREVLAALDGAATRPTFAATANRTRAWIAALVVIALLTVAGIMAWCGRSASADSALRAVAVLPCANVDRDTAAEYFVDGITGELIGRLAQVPVLRVTPRASAFSMRGRGLELPEIGRRLKVGTIVECTIRRLGPNVRVTADLVDLAGERTLWAGTFEGALGGIVAVQDTIARAVTAALRVGGGATAMRGATDTATYLLFLRGRWLWNQRTVSSMRRGIASLEAAIARDSTFAPAWAELGIADALLPAFGDGRPADAVPRARAAARRALQLDSTLAAAHVAAGILATFFDHDFPAALQHFDLAIRLDPTDANARLFRTWTLVALGRTPDALTSILEARRLDPFAPIINT
ncbi:MAG: protein kinase, partial [Gemmatimonadetes bacterium]|nr:protein kinase [Gemmatimonadota bacterium]